MNLFRLYSVFLNPTEHIAPERSSQHITPDGRLKNHPGIVDSHYLLTKPPFSQDKTLSTEDNSDSVTMVTGRIAIGRLSSCTQ